MGSFPNHALAVDRLRKMVQDARTRKQTVVPRGAGYSYDAARNTRGTVMDVSWMNHILFLDRVNGFIQVEPGVTIGQLCNHVLARDWWPCALPPFEKATLGGCLSMNVHGANSWQEGSIGDSVQTIDLLLASGDCIPVSKSAHPELFDAVIGGLGMLGIITSVTLRLQPAQSGSLRMYHRNARSLADMIAIFKEETSHANYWLGQVDAQAEGHHLGRGVVTCAHFVAEAAPHARRDMGVDRFLRPLLGDRNRNPDYMPMYNFHFPTNPPRYIAHPERYRFFQPIVPGGNASAVFAELLGCSRRAGIVPSHCALRRYRGDHYTLGYPSDGFSLELVYRKTRSNNARLTRLLQEMLTLVIDNGGRLCLDNDDILDASTFKKSVSEEVVATFRGIKNRYDPESLFLSDLYRRLFQ